MMGGEEWGRGGRGRGERLLGGEEGGIYGWGWVEIRARAAVRSKGATRVEWQKF